MAYTHLPILLLNTAKSHGLYIKQAAERWRADRRGRAVRARGTPLQPIPGVSIGLCPTLRASELASKKCQRALTKDVPTSLFSRAKEPRSQEKGSLARWESFRQWLLYRVTGITTAAWLPSSGACQAPCGPPCCLPPTTTVLWGDAM